MAIVLGKTATSPTTTFEDIEKTIINHLNSNWTATPIQWPNTDKDMSGENDWIAPSIVPINTYQMTITGDTDTGIMNKGELVIAVHVLPNTGTKLVKQHIDDLRDIFRYLRLIVSGSSIIQFKVPEPSIGGRQGIWWVEFVSIPFEYLE